MKKQLILLITYFIYMFAMYEMAKEKIRILPFILFFTYLFYISYFVFKIVLVLKEHPKMLLAVIIPLSIHAVVIGILIDNIIFMMVGVILAVFFAIKLIKYL